MNRKDLKNPLFFQIGFNRCATTSLFRLFQKSGVKSIQFTGQKPHHVAGIEPLKFNAQRKIRNNILHQKDPLDDLAGIEAFFDMSCMIGNDIVENFKQFKVLYKYYPNAKYILNTRSKQSWIKSRIFHRKGYFLKFLAEAYGVTQVEIVQGWLNDFDTHHAEVRAFFADKPGAMLEFDVEKDDIEKLIAFAQPQLSLNLEKWGRFNERYLDDQTILRVSKDIFDIDD
jgi:hypothetical protein